MNRVALHSAARNLRTLGNVWLARRASRTPRYLPVLLAFVTYRCNLRCAMCGVADHPSASGEGELTTGEWKRVLDGAAALRTSIVSISGGEALLRPDVFDLIAHARGHGIAVHLCTNATTIDRAVAHEIAASGTHTVSLSLESSDEAVHDALRGDGSFAATVAGIEALRGQAPGVRIGVNVLLSRRNAHTAPDTVRFAAEIGAQQVKFMPLHDNLLHRFRPKGELQPLAFEDEERGILEWRIREIEATARDLGLQINSPRFLRGIVDRRHRAAGLRCVAGYTVCAVGPTGIVTPCCDMIDGPDVRQQPLERIWSSDAFDELRRRVDACPFPCWDTTNAELSLRLSPRSLLVDPRHTWRDLRFYFAGGRR